MAAKIAGRKIKDKILAAASELFFDKGFQAVSVDEIVIQAGISKMTLYRYFISKDQLVMEVLRQYEDEWWRWFEPAVKNLGNTPLKQLKAIFDLLAESIDQKEFQGSLFINARIFIADKFYPIFLFTESHRQRLQDFIANLVLAANFAKPGQITDQLMLLITSVGIVAIIESPDNMGKAAKIIQKMAVLVINSNKRHSRIQANKV